MTAPLVYTFTLSQVAIVLGLIYTMFYGYCLWKPAQAESVLKRFPRHYPTGVVLTILAWGWFLWLLQTMDLMEYTPHRPKFFLGFTLIAIGAVVYLKDFLAVRALAVLLLLLAKVLLDAAFLRDEPSKLLITVLAYLMVIKGMTLTAWPYLMRDSLNWFYARPQWIRPLLSIGIALGAILLIMGLFIY